MKTLEEVMQYQSECLDNRDLSRLIVFMTESQIEEMGLELKDEFKGKHVPIEFTRENVLERLRHDVDFGFEKALDKRSISAGLMYQVVKMWNWILEEGLEDFDSYPMYGLPLFKVTALKYGFPNPIGSDSGSEAKYNE